MLRANSNLGTLKNLYTDACVKFSVLTNDVHKASLMILGTVLFFTAGADTASAGQGSYGDACNKLLLLIEGAFGALIAAAAGVAAIVAAALGGFKMAWSLVVVSIGSFVLRAYISLFNGECGGGGGGGFN